MMGNGKVLVASSVPFTSMPTRAPVAVVGNLCELCFNIFMTT